MRIARLTIGMAVVACAIGYQANTSDAKQIRIPATAEATARNDSQTKTNRSLYRFELPTELDSVLIDRAVLKVRFDTSLFEQDVMLVRVFPVIETWSSGAQALSSKPSVNDTAGVVWVARRTDTRDAEIDVFPIVHDWITGRYTNYGLVVEPLVDSENALTAESPTVARSGESAILEVTYRSRETGIPGVD